MSIIRMFLNWLLFRALSFLKSAPVINSDFCTTELLVYILLEKYYKILFMCCDYEMI
jgi:hypothetical protein